VGSAVEPSAPYPFSAPTGLLMEADLPSQLR
jgi:hypothetical protein